MSAGVSDINEPRGLYIGDVLGEEYDVPVGTHTDENYRFFLDLLRKHCIKFLNGITGMKGKPYDFRKPIIDTFGFEDTTQQVIIEDTLQQICVTYNLKKLDKKMCGIWKRAWSNPDVDTSQGKAKFDNFVELGGLKAIKEIQSALKNIIISSTKKPLCYKIYQNSLKTLYPNMSNTDKMIFDILFMKTFVSWDGKFGDIKEHIFHNVLCLFGGPNKAFFSKYRRNGKFSFFWYNFIDPNAKNNLKLEVNSTRCKRLLKAKSVNDWLFKPISDGELSTKDFSYITDLPYVTNILKTAYIKGEKGINILLYGVPGTGKTELAKALSKELGATLFGTGSLAAIFDGKRTICTEKIRDVQLINEIIPEDNKPIILIDEAEDIFYNDDNNDNISKANLNEILEHTKYPIIWTTNNQWIDVAFLRRFTYCICFDDIPRFKQKEIMENIAKKEDIKISDDIITSMIDNKLNFGNVKNILHTAKLNNATEENIINHIEQTVRSVGNTYTDFKHKDGNYFDPRLTNTDIDLIRLSEKIKSTGKSNFTICSYGAPGTGKSAYAEYLADLLNMSIIKKKTSDLLSMWVGGTEQNIAKAFREAKDSKAILVFDEADSLLQDRRNAHNSWEVTQVNEMLVQMEHHPYPFICTTNLFDKLDQASLRRFTFKIGYKYMTDTQIKLAFKHFFNIDAPVDNFHLSTCTVGDFMNIKKQVEFLGTNSYNDIIEMLHKEQYNKNDDKPKTKIGFC